MEIRDPVHGALFPDPPPSPVLGAFYDPLRPIQRESDFPDLQRVPFRGFAASSHRRGRVHAAFVPQQMYLVWSGPSSPASRPAGGGGLRGGRLEGLAGGGGGAERFGGGSAGGCGGVLAVGPMAHGAYESLPVFGVDVDNETTRSCELSPTLLMMSCRPSVRSAYPYLSRRPSCTSRPWLCRPARSSSGPLA